MSEDSLRPGEFGAVFVEFMRAMHEAAEFPESPIVKRLGEHLGVEPGELPVTSAEFVLADRPNLQLALDAVLSERELLGLPPHAMEMGGGFAAVFSNRHMPGGPSARPVEYADVEVGDGRVIRCIASAVILARFDDTPVALVIGSGGGPRHHPRFGPPMHQPTVAIEGIAAVEGTISALLASIRAAMVEHSVFRGKVISLDPSGAATFHTIPVIARDGVVLPKGTLERLEQHAIGITDRANELKQAGRHLKRGILLHGPPGTGKTLTVNYLLSATPGRTTVLLTGTGLGMIGPAFAIARELAPSTVVLEDVDLVAQERTMPGGGHGVLFELLNELEGIAEDADLLAVLTTNRPDVVEPALAARPGRVDLALETSLPDEDGRRRLLRLYAREIKLEPEAENELAERTAGVTGAFIKELMRQAVLSAAARDTHAGSTDVRITLEQLLEEREALTRRLLGQPAGDRHPPQDAPPLPAMARALRISGLPVPPDA
jgi:ATPase family associated with various cellular activities (AAA)